MFQINIIHSQTILITQRKTTEDNMKKWTRLQNTAWILFHELSILYAFL